MRVQEGLCVLGVCYLVCQDHVSIFFIASCYILVFYVLLCYGSGYLMCCVFNSICERNNSQYVFVWLLFVDECYGSV